MFRTAIGRLTPGPVLVLALVLLTLLSLRLQGPPAPAGPDAPEDRFSAERARVHVERLAADPRPVGTPSHDSARAYLVDRLHALGLEPRVDETRLMWRQGRMVGTATVRNVAARLEGSREGGGAVLLAAHYDSRWDTPGAADDAAGVAAILEALRALRAGGDLPLENDLIVLFTDGEELGLLGARAFRQHAWMEDVRVAVNLEARGSSGAALMYRTGRRTGWSVEQLDATGARAVTSSLYEQVYRRLMSEHGDDFGVFRREGIAGLGFAFVEGAEAYHTPLDTPDRLSSASLQHHGETVLALARRLGAVELPAVGSAAGPSPVFFSVPVPGLIRYGPGWGLLFGLLAGLGWLAAALYGRAEGRVTGGGLLAGLAGAGAVIGAAAVAGWGLREAAYATHPEHGWLVAKQLYLAWPYLVAAVATAATVLFALFTLLPGRWTPTSLALGGLGVPAFLAVGLAINIPSGAYLLTWPVLGGVVGVGVLLRRVRRDAGGSPVAGGGRGWIDAGVALLGALPVVALGPPTLRGALAALTLEAAPLLAGASAVLLLCLAPAVAVAARPGGGRAGRWGVVVALGAAAVVLGGGTLLRVAVDPFGPDNTPLVYVADRDRGRAWWATVRDTGDLWLDSFVPEPSPSAAGLRLPAALHSAPGDRRYRAAPAPAVPVDSVLLDVRDGSWTPQGAPRGDARAGSEPGREPGEADDGEAGRRRVTLYVQTPEEPSRPLLALEVRALPEGPDPGRAADDRTRASGSGRVELVAVDGQRVPAGDAPPWDWVVRHFGRLSGPTSVELEVPAGRIPRVEVVLYHAGLPDPPGPLRAARLPGAMGSPVYGGERTLTDVTLVRETVWLRVATGG